jgi:hypothetical protein
MESKESTESAIEHKQKEDELTIKKTIGKYNLINILGRGTFGVVYEGYERKIFQFFQQNFKIIQAKKKFNFFYLNLI